MKKLLFILAAIVAVSAQAAYVDWQYSVAENKTGGTDWTSGHTAYFLTAAAWDTIKDNVTSEALEGAKLDKSGFFLASSNKSKNFYSTGGTGAGVRQVEADTGNYYVILATADGYNVALNNVAITAYSDMASAGTGLTPGVTIPANATSAIAGSGISYTTYSTGGGGSGGGGVPEPTSGLLLALGGAMLALRRRR